MKHPLEWIPDKNRKTLFGLFLGFTLVILFLFQPLNRPLVTAPAPSGIISLQLAWTPENAQAMLDSWYSASRQFAAFSLGFDYLFMPVYAVALALGALLAAGRHPGWFSRLGAWIAYGSFLAAFCDAMENLGQLYELFNGRVDLALAIGIFACLKFALIVLGLLYGFSGWFWKKAR